MPIILAPHEPFGLLPALQDKYYPCVLEVRRYGSPAILFRHLEHIVRAALHQESMIAGRSATPHKIVELTGHAFTRYAGDTP